MHSDPEIVFYRKRSKEEGIEKGKFTIQVLFLINVCQRFFFHLHK